VVPGDAQEEAELPLPPFESRYQLDKVGVTDTFNVLTNHVLKEAYDKHNLFYREEEFVKKKMKTLSMMDKYGSVAKGMSSYAPYIFILWMSFGGNASLGK